VVQTAGTQPIWYDMVRFVHAIAILTPPIAGEFCQESCILYPCSG